MRRCRAAYRAVLDAGGDLALVTAWINQVQAERVRARAQLDRDSGEAANTGRMSRNEIADLVHTLGDIVGALPEADPADKGEVYRQLGLRLTYHPDTKTVYARADLGIHRREMVRVRGGT